MNGKRIAISLLAVFLLVGGIVIANATIVGTSHDLSSSNADAEATSDVDRVCDFCHAPHGATGATTYGALWNRNMPTNGSYTPYDSSISVTMTATPTGTLGAKSLMCMSCHDGSVAIDALYAFPSGVTAAANMAISGTSITGEKIASGVGFLSTNLSTSHPVSFKYNDGEAEATETANDNDAGDIKKMATVVTSGLAFFGASSDQMECATCHNVHDNTNTPFLRKTNVASALCLLCHNR